MSYVSKNRLKDEEIIYQAKLHWMIYFKPFFWLIVTIIFLYFFADEYGLNQASKSEDSSGETIFAVATAIAAICTVVTLLKALIRHISSEYVVTTKRLILKSGIIARNSLELMLIKCEGISVRLGIFGRLLGYGSIIATTGGATNSFSLIKDPVSFRNHINEQIDIINSASK